MTGEDVKLLQEKITGKCHNYNNYDYCLKFCIELQKSNETLQVKAGTGHRN